MVVPATRSIKDVRNPENQIGIGTGPWPLPENSRKNDEKINGDWLQRRQSVPKAERPSASESAQSGAGTGPIQFNDCVLGKFVGIGS